MTKRNQGNNSTYSCIRKSKISRINLTKKVKDLYTENCETLMKGTEEDTNKWKDIPCSWTGKINIVKMSILPKGVYRFKGILIQLPMAFFLQNRTNDSKISMKPQRHQIDKALLRKRDKVRGTTLSDFILYYKDVLIKTVWCWYNNRPIDQWNRIKGQK